MKDKNLKKLDNFIKFTEKNKSSHWKKYLNSKSDIKNIFFSKYPWGKGKKIFLENCHWHQKFYTFFFPFIKKYDGNIKHCLIYYN